MPSDQFGWRSLARARSGTAASKAALDWLEELRTHMIPKAEQLEPIDQESPILVLWSRQLDGAGYRHIRRQAAERIQRLLESP